MCTVIYLPLSSKEYIISSNRDEDPTRETNTPSVIKNQSMSFIAPIDAKAGGTWIGARADKKTIVVLNGGFVRHERRVYGKSRGLIVRELLEHPSPEILIHQIDYTEIEPFTLLITSTDFIYELVWDGLQPHFFEHSSDQPLIRSSSTLYDNNAKAIRTDLFLKWLETNTEFSKENLIRFLHSYNDKQNGYVMNREFVRTVSISIISLLEKEISFDYTDILKNKNYVVTLE